MIAAQIHRVFQQVGDETARLLIAPQSRCRPDA
jgi:hypothetical protein